MTIEDAKPARAKDYLPQMPDDVIGMVMDVAWGAEIEGIEISDTETLNAANHVYFGTAIVNGLKHAFIVESGDLNGTLIRAWGDPEIVGLPAREPPPEPYTFIPRDPETLRSERPGLWGVYLQWRASAWFRDKERAYNYDRFFQPGLKTARHYGEWAAKKGMKIGRLSDLSAGALADARAADEKGRV